MNYNPFFYQMPTSSMLPAATSIGSKGLLSSLFGGMNFGTLVTNAGKTLGVINQAIPVVKQVRPIMSNAKTMFKVMNEFKKTETPVSQTTNSNTVENSSSSVKENTVPTDVQTENLNSDIKFDGSPVFFM